MNSFQSILEKYTREFYPIVSVAEDDIIKTLDISETNKDFTEKNFNDINLFSDWINEQKQKAGTRFLFGGYNENRAMYSRSKLFDGTQGENVEPRSLHLGLDIWSDAGTKVYAPQDATVHSFAFNKQHGDYGATIILQHELEGVVFYTLYGHLSLKDLEGLEKGKPIQKGEVFAHFGSPEENGNWPPHLHFQLIADIVGFHGDYPGVCKPSESKYYLQNCPDPLLVFNPKS
ncbi:MAG: peptidoglycan DD-metalloendopeptidase family protein [Ferruginibacter sp.]